MLHGLRSSSIRPGQILRTDPLGEVSIWVSEEWRFKNLSNELPRSRVWSIEAYGAHRDTSGYVITVLPVDSPISRQKKERRFQQVLSSRLLGLGTKEQVTVILADAE